MNNSTLTDKLISHLGLKGDPFSLSTQVFFEGAQRSHNLETLRHMSSFGDMVLIVTGEKGAGKTTLVRQFVNISEELNVILVPGPSSDTSSKARTVIQELCQQLGLSPVAGETAQQAFSRIVQFIQAKYESENIRSVIVFDDADLLSKKEFQFYLNVFKSLSQDSGLVGVFAGLPSIIQKARLSCEYEEEEWLHQIQLKHLSVSDCLEYIIARLEAVGFDGNLDLTDMQLAHLAEAGKGLPGRINRMFSSVLLEPGNLKVNQRKAGKVPKQIFVGLAALLVFSFVFVAYQYDVFQSAKVDDDNESETVLVKSEALEKDRDRIFQEKQKELRLKMLDKAISESLPADQRFKLNKVDSSIVQDGAPVEIGSSDTRKEGGISLNDGSDLEENSDVIKSVDQKVIGAKVSREHVDLSERVVGDVAENKSEEDGQKETNLDISVSAAALTKVSDKKNNEGAVQKRDEPKENKKSQYFRAKSWVESIPADSFGAQVLGSHKEQTAINFAKKISSQGDDIYYLKTLYKGKDWYVVFYGVYEDKARANKALKSAPALIRNQKPWLRSFGAILKSYPK